MFISDLVKQFLTNDWGEESLTVDGIHLMASIA